MAQLLLAAAAAAAAGEPPAPAAAAAGPTPRSPPHPSSAACAFAHNLSGFRLIRFSHEESANTTEAACRAACCAEPACTAWNYHVASNDAEHNVRSCWLDSGAEVAVTLASQDSTFDGDVWAGGARRPVKDCTAGGCGGPPPPPAWPPVPHPTPCNGTNYTRCRYELWKYVFNTTDGELPSRERPDFIEDMSDWEMVGVPGPGQGTGVGVSTATVLPPAAVA